MKFSFLNRWITKENEKYDYVALAKEFENKCPTDYPWMKKEKCQKLGILWAWQAGAMTEAPEIAFDNELFNTRDRAKCDGRLESNASGFETYYANHPIST